MKTMKQHLLFFLAATSMLAACSSMDESADQPADKQQTDQQAVTFGAYVNRGTTRSGKAGEMDLTLLKEASGVTKNDGFGVFGYYTNDAPYSTTALPNFMYNQQVTWNSGGGRWTYSPVKYWPNETGSAAQSVGIDRLTFFAYAPYVEIPDANFGLTEDTSYGITALTRANESGYPYVRYYVTTDPSKCVDLCWAETTDHINMVKPTGSTNTPVSFNFKHALAALNVQIDADVDNTTPHDHINPVDANTRIFVRSITFTGFATKGQLNLYNGAWNNLECDCDVTSAPVTIYDGRWDRFEGMSESPNENPTGLNPAIVQWCSYADLDLESAAWETKYSGKTQPTGVTNSAVNLFNSATATDPIYVIPTTVPIRVTIVYDVETRDPKLIANYLGDGVTNGSSIENNITAIVKDASDNDITLTAGKKYTLNLHLGMKSVKVEATVADWETGNTVPVEVPQ